LNRGCGKKYSKNYFGAGIIAVEKSRAGPTTTVRLRELGDWPPNYNLGYISYI
jgi:hypothetical protein